MRNTVSQIKIGSHFYLETIHKSRDANFDNFQTLSPSGDAKFDIELVFNDKMVSSSMSLEATICMFSNQGVSKCLAMFLNVSRAHRERYARSPESILTPIAV